MATSSRPLQISAAGCPRSRSSSCTTTTSRSYQRCHLPTHFAFHLHSRPRRACMRAPATRSGREPPCRAFAEFLRPFAEGEEDHTGEQRAQVAPTLCRRRQVISLIQPQQQPDRGAPCRAREAASRGAHRLPRPHRRPGPDPDPDRSPNPNQVLFLSDNKLTSLPDAFGQTRKMQASLPTHSMRPPPKPPAAASFSTSTSTRTSTVRSTAHFCPRCSASTSRVTGSRAARTSSSTSNSSATQAAASSGRPRAERARVAE